MKRILGLAVLLVISAGATDDFGMKLVAFDKHYNTFVRKFCGWPAKGEITVPCYPALGRFGTPEWKDTRTAAMRLFNLVEKKDK